MKLCPTKIYHDQDFLILINISTNLQNFNDFNFEERNLIKQKYQENLLNFAKKGKIFSGKFLNVENEFTESNECFYIDCKSTINLNSVKNFIQKSKKELKIPDAISESEKIKFLTFAKKSKVNVIFQNDFVYTSLNNIEDIEFKNYKERLKNYLLRLMKI